MDGNGTSTRRAVGHTRRGAAVTALVLLSLPTSGCALLGNAYSRQQIDVEAFSDPRWQDWEPMRGLEVRSSALCAEVEGCLQAVASDHLVIMKFDSVSSAEAYVGGGSASLQQIDPLVVDFRDSDLSQSDRDAIVSTLSNINADSPD